WATASVTKTSRSSSASSGGDWGAAVAAPVGAATDNEETPLDAGGRRQAPTRRFGAQERERRGVAEEAEAQGLHLLQGTHRSRRLQRRHHVAEVRVRARQDPRASGH